ncbi:hypothetical protein NKF26_08180 [Haladaptatus sp. AB618]|uniref:DUF7562 family protein n=1 Tax=Haladaptatus sp. AB618 TaxID=2934173 RepID=UPI00209C2814|nr:hypothetical protein [Haladaptatus sp. AB618]MCO8253775.1 hypothetical protein [Haladaptatus sp. AB618]
MWGSRWTREKKSVDCIACGDAVRRSAAREYDKEGNRWERNGKTFEHLCKACHRELCHQPRDELEGLLVEMDADHVEQDEFLARYETAIRDRYGPLEEREG